jgi:hypothetical protein
MRSANPFPFTESDPPIQERWNLFLAASVPAGDPDNGPTGSRIAGGIIEPSSNQN